MCEKLYCIDPQDVDDVDDEDFYDDDPEDVDMEKACVECWDGNAWHECGCCGDSLCSRCSEIGAGFCKDCLNDPNFGKRMEAIYKGELYDSVSSECLSLKGMVKTFLFETRPGEAILWLLENFLGLVVEPYGKD